MISLDEDKEGKGLGSTISYCKWLDYDTNLNTHRSKVFLWEETGVRVRYISFKLDFHGDGSG